MGLLADEIGNKVAGELIKSQDWNRLVEAVESVEATLNERIDTLETTLSRQIAGLTTQITQLRTDVDALKAVVDPLVQQYYRLNLSTERVNYALGQLAEITVRVTDLRGNSLTFSSSQNRPWVDLVATWGQFRAVSGFTSLGGVGDRTISVQVNNEGIARVQLRSDYAEGLTDEDEAEMATVLQSRPQGFSITFAEAIINATTPAEARPTYQLMRSEYERSTRVRTYLDTHYVRHPAISVGNILTGLGSRWRDYRSTVMAFAKADSNPTTPDPSLGVSSLQITFRDWIGPWIVDFIDPPVAELPIGSYRDRLRPKITPRYVESTQLVKDEIDDIVRGKGLLAKQRDYRTLTEALNQLDPEVSPPFLNTLTESMQNAIGIQQALGVTQTKALGITNQEVGFKVFTDAALRADTNTAAVQEELTQAVQTQVTQSINQARQTLQQEQQAFRTSIEAENGVVQRAIRQQLAPIQQEVTTLRTLDPGLVNNQLRDVTALKAQVDQLSRFIQR
jgi:uncharacterized coiled-coil protein SlyX